MKDPRRRQADPGLSHSLGSLRLYTCFFWKPVGKAMGEPWKNIGLPTLRSDIVWSWVLVIHVIFLTFLVTPCPGFLPHLYPFRFGTLMLCAWWLPGFSCHISLFGNCTFVFVCRQLMVREKLPTSSVGDQVSFHYSYFFWGQDFAL